MNEDTTILPFRQSETIIDPLTELARQGARRMLAEALKAEADAFVASFADEQLEDGRQRIVRHGFGPERKIQTGIGALDVQRVRAHGLGQDVGGQHLALLEQVGVLPLGVVVALGVTGTGLDRGAAHLA